MSVPSRSAVLVLCQWAGQSFEQAGRIVQASAETGGDAHAEAVAARDAFGWLCGFLQEQIQSRPDEFLDVLTDGLEDDLRTLLEGDAGT